VKEALESPDSPFYNVKTSIKEPWFLKFNNSAIYQSNDDDAFKKLYWEICMSSFKRFYDSKVTILPQKSLTLTQEVLKTR
jgi:hypothetical protein